jgi:class 3 adenylate cyclase
MSQNRILENRKQFDSLRHLVIQQMDAGNFDSTLFEKMYDCLSLAQLMKNDSLLAITYFYLSRYFDAIADYPTSVEYSYKAIDIYEKQKDFSMLTISYNNMSWAYIQTLDFENGIGACRHGLKFSTHLVDENRRKELRGLLFNNLAIACLESGKTDSALYYNSLSYSEVPGALRESPYLYVWIFAVFGHIYEIKMDTGQALKCFNQSLQLKDSSVNADATIYTVSKYCHFLNSLGEYQKVIRIGKEGITIAKNSNLKRYMIDIADELQYAYEKLNRVDSAYYFAKIAKGVKNHVFNQGKTAQLQNLFISRTIKAKELEYAIEKAKAEEKLASEQRLRNIFLIAFIFVVLFAGLFLYQRNKIKAGKIRSDELLLNILPGEVAEELKTKGSTSAKHFESVTVMFTDFKNFTQISEKLSPQELVSEIDTCFKAFDQIIGKYNIEKIKTIGDSYMCAGGLPVSTTTHSKDVVSAALEIQHFIRQHVEQRKSEGKEPFEVRIGIHTGPIVAGIVGLKKFAYDIWGDTVNTASRMESSGEIGKVNISETTYELVKDQFACTYRGKIHVKNKGELDMYFVEG